MTKRNYVLLTVRVVCPGLNVDVDDVLGFDKSQSMSHPFPLESMTIFPGLMSP
jgi:hypothetical protein